MLPPPPIFISSDELKLKPKANNENCTVTVQMGLKAGYYTCPNDGPTSDFAAGGSCSKTGECGPALYTQATDCAKANREANLQALRDQAHSNCPSSTIDYFVD